MGQGKVYGSLFPRITQLLGFDVIASFTDNCLFYVFPPEYLRPSDQSLMQAGASFFYIQDAPHEYEGNRKFIAYSL